MNLPTLVIAGVLTGTSFLNGADGRNEDSGSITALSGAPAPSAAVVDPGSDRRAGRWRDQEPTSWDIKLAADDEPGERLVLDGRVLGHDRAPVAGAKVFVYQPDSWGFYSENHGMDVAAPRLCGVLRTDDQGRYRLSTVRPGRSGGAESHVHFEVLNGRASENFVLTFDARPAGAAGRSAATDAARRPLERDARGVWHCRRDLIVRR